MKLIGDSNLIEKWALKSYDSKELSLSNILNDWKTSLYPPILSCKNIPEEWLGNHPGFWVFSIDEVPEHFPTWIVSPYKTNNRHYYGLRQTQTLKRNTLVTVLGTEIPENLANEYDQLLYTSYEIIEENNDVNYKNPLNLILDSGEFFDFYDSSFGLNTTYSPIHLYTLLSGGLIFGLPQYDSTFLQESINMGFWNWDIFYET